MVLDSVIRATGVLNQLIFENHFKEPQSTNHLFLTGTQGSAEADLRRPVSPLHAGITTENQKNTSGPNLLTLLCNARAISSAVTAVNARRRKSVFDRLKRLPADETPRRRETSLFLLVGVGVE